MNSWEKVLNAKKEDFWEAATENKKGSKKGKVRNLTGKKILQVREDSEIVVFAGKCPGTLAGSMRDW